MSFLNLSITKKFLASLIVGVQVVAALAIPLNTAQAAATYPGTPQDPTATENVCFGATESFFGFVHQYCYPSMAACNAGWSTVPSKNRDNACIDNYSNRSGVEKAMAWFKQAPKTVGGAALDAAGAAAMKLVALLAEWINKLAAIFLSSMAYVLDASIDRTINPNTYKYLTSVLVGWTAVRDLTNMFFIFVLLYIAIRTILGIDSAQTKRLVAHLIIAALLINFSLFITQVVIDAGNMLAVGFWDKISSRQGGTDVSSASAKFMEGFRVQTVYSNTNEMAASSGGDGSVPLDDTQRAMINLGGALVMFVAGYVFLAGAIMMVVRTVVLIIVMIMSPFAFLGFALPKGGSFADTWFKHLMGSTFVAPAFTFMLYLDSIIISNDAAKLADASSSGWSSALSGSGDNFAIVYNFLVMIILLLGSIYVAKQVSGLVANSAGGYAKSVLGHGAGLGVAVAGITGGRVGRQIGGSAGRMIQNSKTLDAWAQRKNNPILRNIASTAKRTGGAMAKGTWDVRNTGAVGTLNTGLGMANTGVKVQGPLLSGSKKSYETHGGIVGSTLTAGVVGVGAGVAAANRVIRGEEKPKAPEKPVEKSPFVFRGTENEKKTIEKAKELYGFNPEARDQYLRDHGVDLSAPRNKETATSLKRDLAKTEAKKALDDQKKAQEALDKKVADKLKTPEEAVKEGEIIAKAVKEAMMKLTTTEKAELAPLHKDNMHFINNLDKSDYSMIHKAEMEGKTNGALKDITENIMKSNNEKLQEYILKPENQNRLTMIDQDTIRNTPNLMENYNRQVNRIKDKDKAHEEALKENAERNKAATEQKQAAAIQSAFEMK